MEISFKGCTTPSLLISCIGGGPLFISITIVPLRPMFTPRPHTNPAEFVGTFPTGHMVATTVLFDRGVTSGTFLGVCWYPIRCFGIIFAFLEPLLDERTCAGLMIGQGTAEAETMATATTHGRYNMIELGGRDMTFDGIFTVWGGTPFEVIIIVDISPIQ